MRVIEKQHVTHPSYGVVAMERIGGYTPRLVGSVSGQHQTAIRLSIARGSRWGDENDSWSTIGKPIAVVEMSLLQWAELITLTAMGVHTPCTLVTVDGERQPEPPHADSAIERVLEESRADLFDGPDPSDAARAELLALRAEIEALKVTKAVKADLVRRIEAAQSKLREPGIVAHVAAERLGRHLATVATEARMEARASNVPGLAPEHAIDAVIGHMLPAAEVEDE
jgi:hypothetical protein